MTMQLFKEELAYYNNHRAELLSRHEWKFVLIKGSDLIGVFDNAQAAYQEGLRRFGSAVFLMKQVLKEEPVQHLPAFTLGILHATA